MGLYASYTNFFFIGKEKLHNENLISKVRKLYRYL